eukprot:1147595-Pelagomonas_calceolata.AAC.14
MDTLLEPVGSVRGSVLWESWAWVPESGHRGIAARGHIAASIRQAPWCINSISLQPDIVWTHSLWNLLLPPVLCTLIKASTC